MLWRRYAGVILVIVNLVRCYKVLVFFPYPAVSHSILGEAYARHLLKAGHNVTYVTIRPLKYSGQNLTQIVVSSPKLLFEVVNKTLNIKHLMDIKTEEEDLYKTYRTLHDIAELSLKHKKVQKLLLDRNEYFDVAIVEWLYSELYAGIAAVFNCPFIWSSSMETHPMVLRLIDEFPNPSYMPINNNEMSLKPPPFTFWQRVIDLWTLLKVHYVKWQLFDTETKAYEKAYGPAFAIRGRKIPDFQEVIYNASLMFGTSHVSLGLPIRLPQNYKPIAGFHIKNQGPLSEKLNNIMNNAAHGVIYFSMGSMTQGKTLPVKLKTGFLKTFSTLQQIVIWKMEERIPNLPTNVHIVGWAPQSTILGHPNLVLFINHGGLLSIFEALHFRVPVIAIPIFADQLINAERMVAKGFGIQVPLDYDTPVNLKTAIRYILGNLNRYRRKVKEVSLVYYDRPVPPGEEMVFWVEHVVKTRGALHLRSLTLAAPWYQRLYLDLLVLIILGIFVMVIIVKKM